MLRITAEQRRARLLSRHGLGPPGVGTVTDAAQAVVALHATDPASVYLSALARCPGLGIADVATALYDDRELVKLLAMRRTLFAVPVELASVVHAAVGVDVAAKARAALLLDLGRIPTDPPLDEPPEAWLDDVETGVMKALAERRTAAAAQLADDEPRLRTAFLPTTQKAYDVRRAATSRVLTVLGAEGKIVRGRPLGGWTSRSNTWELADSWWPGGLPAVPTDQARVELARRWLRAFGPATVADVQWWTGWTLGTTRRALAAVPTVEVELDGVPGIVLADDVAPEPAQPPSAVLLPSLDPTPMGWKHRDWFLAVEPPALFDRSGNIGPTVWWGGEVIGCWAVRTDGELVWRLLADRGREAASAVAEAAAVLHARLGGSTVVPSFATPLERELRLAR